MSICSCLVISLFIYLFRSVAISSLLYVCLFLHSGLPFVLYVFRCFFLYTWILVFLYFVRSLIIDLLLFVLD